MSVSSEIITVLDNICEKFGIAIDWTQSNILPYLQTLMDKIVLYEISTSVAFTAMFFIVIIICCIISHKSYVIVKTKGINYNEGLPFIILGISCCIIVVLFVAVCMQVFDIITCYTFPEKAIFDFAQNYMYTR